MFFSSRLLENIVPSCKENPQIQRILLAAFGFYAFSNLISMAVMSLGAITLVLVLLGVTFRTARTPSTSDSSTFGIVDLTYFKWTLALIVACIASLGATKFFPLSFEGHSVTVRLFRDSMKLWYFVWPLVIAFGLQLLTVSNRKRVMNVVFYTFLGLCAVGVIQHYTGWPRKQHIPENPVLHHAVLFIGHHLSVSSIFIFPWFIFLNRAWNARFKDKKMVFFVIAGAILLFFTYSRMLWISWPLGCALFVVLKLPRKSRVKVILAVAVALAAFTLIPDVRMRFTSSQGIFTRELIWKHNFELFQRRPILGVGWQHSIDHKTLYEKHELKHTGFFEGHSHNNFLEALVTTGVVGALIWLFWWIYIFKVAWQSRHFEGQADYVSGTGLFCAMVVFQLNGLTQVNFGDAKVLHQLMWVIGWMLFERRRLSSWVPVRK